MLCNAVDSLRSFCHRLLKLFTLLAALGSSRKRCAIAAGFQRLRSASPPRANPVWNARRRRAHEYSEAATNPFVGLDGTDGEAVEILTEGVEAVA